MITHICDRCGRPIERGQLRYVAKIEVFAAADPLEITLEDLLRDTRREMDRLLQLEVFSKTAELGSLSKAADSLRMSNAAASRHLQRRGHTISILLGAFLARAGFLPAGPWQSPSAQREEA